jgi:hypothetical protein
MHDRTSSAISAVLDRPLKKTRLTVGIHPDTAIRDDIREETRSRSRPDTERSP